MRIADWPLYEVKIECVKCGLKTTLLREKLEVVFESDADLFSTSKSVRIRVPASGRGRGPAAFGLDGRAV